MRELQLKKMVRNSYAKIVMRKGSCCGNTAVANDISKCVGYSENELNIMHKLVKHHMENAVRLAVPVKVGVEYGRNWLEMTEL